ncbi:hypothetical protein FACS189472_09990 [Alphaproteobacteria bacterium]|nr:hypothetical protein FACS189472_09990 [Alphaproteobacteria bacterium]
MGSKEEASDADEEGGGDGEGVAAMRRGGEDTPAGEDVERGSR